MLTLFYRFFIGYTVVHVSFLFCMMCMFLCTVICSPKLKCPVLCVNFIVLAFIVLAFCIFLFLTAVIFVLPFGVIKNNNNKE